ncbi:ABC transporter ATP-binding protein [Stenotrophomonas maltophilia]|uniref:Sugar ABC transporter ATP-binding protein n=1 Tax=Stenotrophomonas maltophilia TaxID=40324 RepID=A0AB34TMI3_STEMA|nr:ABC transporter ATP-binding protein [Stenotrophomonas maltophilia]KOO83793.1 sugar ABC transporter ATP-binding protein [Stenotrophomonas maltophilia]MBN5107515.1 ABC transporter ATP-binding protein [Stenotrophomonas maltophilia]
MSSDTNISIRVEDLGKCYQIYPNPATRMKQALANRVHGALGRTPPKYFSEFWALRDIGFEVPRGEAFGVIGRNGSGKSTLLQLITGVLTPTQGSVQTRGRIAALLELGSGFNPEFSGRENVYLNGMLLGLSRAEIDARFDGIAAFADIGEHLERPIKTYSSGMLVRLAFAVQVQIDPDILIIDEALAVGDALFQKRCFARINRLADDGVTILFVSHDQETVRTVTRRSLLLHQGRAIAMGTSSETLRAYRRLINNEESKYFASLAERHIVVEGIDPSADGNEVALPASVMPSEDVPVAPDSATEDVTATEVPEIDETSTGTGHALVQRVVTLDEAGEPCAVFYPGEKVRIQIQFKAQVDLKNLNVSLRIRNREGLKIYSWGTLNQDMQVAAGVSQAPVFWERKFDKGEEASALFDFVCPLGPGFYEIQAIISHEGQPDYSDQTILHWKDEAAFFQVFLDQKAYHFGGSFDLRMSATW